MLTEKEIDEQIDADVKRYNSSQYDGWLPDNFIESFKKAVMSVPYNEHRTDMAYIGQVVKKRQDELTLLDVGMINNIVLLIRPCDIYKDIDEYVSVMSGLQKVAIQYNKSVEDFEKSMNRKKAALMRIAGLDNKTAKIERPSLGAVK